MKHTFIHFNEHSPAMLPSKSTPGYRYGRATFGIGHASSIVEGEDVRLAPAIELDQSSPTCSPGGAVGALTSYGYMPDLLSPVQGTVSTLGSHSSSASKDEPAKIEASESLTRGRLWTLGEGSDTEDVGKDKPAVLKNTSSVRFSDSDEIRKKSFKDRHDKVASVYPVQPRISGSDEVQKKYKDRHDKVASVYPVQSGRNDEAGQTAPKHVPLEDEVAVLPSSPMVNAVKSSLSRRKKKKRAEMPAPVTVQQKYGFVHFDEGGSTPSGPGVRAIRTGPAAVLGGRAGSDESSEYEDEEDDGTGSSSSDASWHSSAGSAAGVEDLEAEVVIWRGDGLERDQFVPQDEMEGQDSMRLTCLLNCRTAEGKLANLGARVHTEGRCVPCLMQCRYTAGRCKEPCRFGLLCNRCHENHSEEELQKIQAQMRRLRKHKGSRPS